MFRDATDNDAEQLYQWRKEAEREPWYVGRKVTWGTHIAWLEARLDNPLVRIMMWDDPPGMVRIDSNGELSFYGGNPAMLREAKDFGARKACLDVADSEKRFRLVRAGWTSSAATSLSA